MSLTIGNILPDFLFATPLTADITVSAENHTKCRNLFFEHLACLPNEPLQRWCARNEIKVVLASDSANGKAGFDLMTAQEVEEAKVESKLRLG